MTEVFSDSITQYKQHSRSYLQHQTADTPVGWL